MIGLGTSLVFPTAGSNEFVGNGKYQAGPAYAYINTVFKGLQFGVIGWHEWDVADGPGGSDKPYVSESSVQPLLIKHFGEGLVCGAAGYPLEIRLATRQLVDADGSQGGKSRKTWPDAAQPVRGRLLRSFHT
jgi:hypothetical protein